MHITYCTSKGYRNISKLTSISEIDFQPPNYRLFKFIIERGQFESSEHTVAAREKRLKHCVKGSSIVTIEGKNKQQLHKTTKHSRSGEKKNEKTLSRKPKPMHLINLGLRCI